MPSILNFKYYIAIIMSEDNQKESAKAEKNQHEDEKSESETKKEKSLEEKFAESEDKLLRSLAEIENQRRRFEKEIKDAFEFGSFNFAKESLAILDNLQRAKLAIKNDNTPIIIEAAKPAIRGSNFFCIFIYIFF